MDQKQAPVLEALAANQANGHTPFTRPGIGRAAAWTRACSRSSGMLIPDAADSLLESVRVVVEERGY